MAPYNFKSRAPQGHTNDPAAADRNKPQKGARVYQSKGGHRDHRPGRAVAEGNCTDARHENTGERRTTHKRKGDPLQRGDIGR